MNTFTRRLAAMLVAAAASFVVVSGWSALDAAEARRDPRAEALLDSAMTRMGGADALRHITRARLEMMTQWQRISFDERPYVDAPSYERHSELRDYTIPAWRNTRRFVGAGPLREMTDVVSDSVSIRLLPSANGWSPLSIAYVDERREVFAFSPERVLVLARDGGESRVLSDTSVGGIAHARIAARVDGFPTTLFIRRPDGLLAMARYRASQFNDFGLAPWGEMEVELWYSRWQRTASGVSIPTQWDVRRVGRPYKRLTVLSASFDVAASPDSFAISDSLRSAFMATANKPMWDASMDSARVIDDRFAVFGQPGFSMGAVKVGGSWLLLESSSVPSKTAREVAWLSKATSGRVAGAVLTLPNAGMAGTAWVAEQKLPLYVAPGARMSSNVVLRNWRQAPAAATIVTRGRWLRLDGDSLWAEPVDLPDAIGALVLYAPSAKWLYSGPAAGPLQIDALLGLARSRGWVVERIGSARGIVAAVPGR